MDQHKGRFTALNFNRALSRLNTFVIINVILALPHLKSRHLVLIQKASQLNILKKKMLKEIGHKSVKVNECGLCVAKNEPYMGATPDRLVTCDCCPNRVLELKCHKVGQRTDISA